MSSIVSYDIYCPDIEKLCQDVSDKSIFECIVYGIGNNGNFFSKCLKAMNVNVKYYVDVQARLHPSFRQRRVILPEDLKNEYKDEYIIISPNRFDSIVKFLKDIGVKDEKMILPFLFREMVEVNYGYHLTTPSKDIRYCREKIDNPKVTITSIIYNTEEYLFRRSIESVLRQSYRDFIYIIIINGATDGSYEIAKEYERLDTRIKVIRKEENYKWTEKTLLDDVRNNLYGDYWTQLDGDDYFDSDFLNTTISLGKNAADMVAVRTMAIAADSKFDLMDGKTSFDGKDKYWFYYEDPECHAFGQNRIMENFASGKISGTWWGKLWGMKVTKDYFKFLLDLPDEERGCFFRLDTAMTYKMMTLCKRVYFSDKVLHFQSYSPGRTTYSKAPAEWLMSLWYVYKDLKQRFFRWYDYDSALKCINNFLEVFTPWMFARQGLLENIDDSAYADMIYANIDEMYRDTVFMDHVRQRAKERQPYRDFYVRLHDLCTPDTKLEDNASACGEKTCEWERVIGVGALGNNAFALISRLRETKFFPTELWDEKGDNKLIKKPDYLSLTDKDFVIVFPTNGEAVTSIKTMLKGSRATVIFNDEISNWLFENNI